MDAFENEGDYSVIHNVTEQKMAPPPDPGSDEDVSDFDDDDVPPPLPETEPPGQETQVKRDFENQEQDQEPE